MKLFGIIQSFDIKKGFGAILPEAGGDALRFENSAIKWGRTDSPKPKQRLSYELGSNPAGQPCAVNLQTA